MLETMQVHVNYIGQILDVWHRWDIAVFAGQMRADSFCNPSIYSEELMRAIEKHSINFLVPVLWTGIYSEN